MMEKEKKDYETDFDIDFYNAMVDGLDYFNAHKCTFQIPTRIKCRCKTGLPIRFMIASSIRNHLNFFGMDTRSIYMGEIDIYKDYVQLNEKMIGEYNGPEYQKNFGSEQCQKEIEKCKKIIDKYKEIITNYEEKLKDEDVDRYRKDLFKELNIKILINFFCDECIKNAVGCLGCGGSKYMTSFWFAVKQGSRYDWRYLNEKYYFDVRMTKKNVEKKTDEGIITREEVQINLGDEIMNEPISFSFTNSNFRIVLKNNAHKFINVRNLCWFQPTEDHEFWKKHLLGIKGFCLKCDNTIPRFFPPNHIYTGTDEDKECKECGHGKWFHIINEEFETKRRQLEEKLGQFHF